jgi:hypothetical protein
MDLVQGSAQIAIFAKVFEKVTAKDHIEAAVAKWPFVAAILCDKVNSWRKFFGAILDLDLFRISGQHRMRVHIY